MQVLVIKGALSRPFWPNCPNIVQRTWFERELLLQLREENIKVFLQVMMACLLNLFQRKLSHQLCSIFNATTESTTWPETWKKGTWIPVFKKDERHDIRNYRPITVLPIVGKIYEKLLRKQITNFMDSILSDNLTAYRQSHSCETTLIRLVEEWKMELQS